MNKNRRNEILKNTRTLLFYIIAIIIINTSIGRAYKVPTGSMENTLLTGDFLIAEKFVYGARLPLLDLRLPALAQPEPGDVVLFRWPVDGKTVYVKRCVAGPGQTVEIREKVLYVDGKEFGFENKARHIDPDIVPRPAPQVDSRDNWGPYTVPADHYFMMGDNRDNSYDSRYWGPVHRKYLIGTPVFIYWSWRDDPDAPAIDLSDPLSIPRLALYNLTHFPERIRWERLLNPVK